MLRLIMQLLYKHLDTIIESDKIFLKYNQDNWVLCAEKWVGLFPYRKKYYEKELDSSLKSILSDWPILNHSLGYTLVSCTLYYILSSCILSTMYYRFVRTFRFCLVKKSLLDFLINGRALCSSFLR